jgi:hypothetical protein
MESENQTAKVSAARTLMDALADPADRCPVCAEREANPVDVKAKLLALLARGEPERRQQDASSFKKSWPWSPSSTQRSPPASRTGSANAWARRARLTPVVVFRSLF